MKQTVTISQNMGCNPTIIKTPSIMFPAGNRRPTFDNQLIKKKEFKSINTVNSSGPDMSRSTVQIPLKDHVKASYSNGDLKKMSFIGKDDIVNTFYTPPIQIKQNIKRMGRAPSILAKRCEKKVSSINLTLPFLLLPPHKFFEFQNSCRYNC